LTGLAPTLLRTPTFLVDTIQRGQKGSQSALSCPSFLSMSMGRQHYIDKILDHYEKPRHQGAIPKADVIVTGSNPSCGDVITIYLNVGEGNLAEQIQFEGEGCTISQVAASILLDMVQGKPLAEVEAIDYNALIGEMGEEIILTRVGCATLSLSTLKDAIRQYRARQLKLAQT
jgi:nitrogen fixation NifU-like protein